MLAPRQPRLVPANPTGSKADSEIGAPKKKTGPRFVCGAGLRVRSHLRTAAHNVTATEERFSTLAPAR